MPRKIFELIYNVILFLCVEYDVEAFICFQLCVQLKYETMKFYMQHLIFVHMLIIAVDLLMHNSTLLTNKKIAYETQASTAVIPVWI